MIGVTIFMEVLPMPQISKGGKFIYGRSVIREDRTLRLPPQAVREYGAGSEGYGYLFTGSKVTGGFCVTRRGLLEPSKLGHILTDLPDLRDCRTAPGALVPYKGRAYCWLPITPEGVLTLPEALLAGLGLCVGMALLAIRSSDIAFTMGAKGPLLERAAAYPGEIATC